jgi:hypothetical protein
MYALDPVMSLMHILLNSINAHMNERLVALEGGLRPYPLRFYVEEAGADAKLIQHGPLGVAYHSGHPISTVSVARITAHTTVLCLKGGSLWQILTKEDSAITAN